MASSAFERLLRVLDLEEKQGWRNRAVIGGMRSMAERWRSDAEQEDSNLATVNAVVKLMTLYEDAEEPTRIDLARQMRRYLAGDEEPPVVPGRETDSTGGDGADGDYTDGGQAFTPVPLADATDVAAARVRSNRAADQRSVEDLEASIQTINGVGAATAAHLARLGIERVIDLLWHLPHRYEDFSQLKTIAQLRPGEQVTVVANLWEVKERKLSMNRQMVQGILADGTGTLHATWWNRFVKNQLTPGSTMRFSGKVGLYMGQRTLENPAFEDLDEEMVATGRVSPVYRLTEGLTNKRLRNLVRAVLDEYGGLVPDPLPESIRSKYSLPTLPLALAQVHFPDSMDAAEKAFQRLAFDELFFVQLGVLQRRRELKEVSAPALPSDDATISSFRRRLPFSLTNSQERVLAEILDDLSRTVPMTRLVQGDVGSGKTVVAAAAMVVAAKNGKQSAMLAPTQILAEQHFRGISALLETFEVEAGKPVRLALLTGRVQGKNREQIVAGLNARSIDVVVGTTALIQDIVDFADLGLVVVDEQHRFGVEQRGALRSKGQQPHMLVMSATPIPRSLALTVYGDLDVSVIDELPPGRTPVKTKVFDPQDRERLYNFMRREVSEGHQGFIVYPLVEESDKLDAGAAVAEFERLRSEVFPSLRLALLHGRMNGSEKDEVMSSFAAGESDILVSTSVIEVGIDVPNASLMIIENADRFGLAQLHQLRGRVGRGQHASYCALISRADSDDAAERLRALAETNSGFELAEKDLALRGPGDFLGTRQSGLPDLRVAHLSDLDTLEMAREAAKQFASEEAHLTQYPDLAQQVERFWRGHGDIS